MRRSRSARPGASIPKWSEPCTSASRRRSRTRSSTVATGSTFDSSWTATSPNCASPSATTVPDSIRRQRLVGTGLDNMVERLGAVGGALTVSASIGGGTTISGAVPTCPIPVCPAHLRTPASTTSRHALANWHLAVRSRSVDLSTQVGAGSTDVDPEQRSEHERHCQLSASTPATSGCAAGGPDVGLVIGAVAFGVVYRRRRRWRPAETREDAQPIEEECAEGCDRRRSASGSGTGAAIHLEQVLGAAAHETPAPGRCRHALTADPAAARRPVRSGRTRRSHPCDHPTCSENGHRRSSRSPR